MSYELGHLRAELAGTNEAVNRIWQHMVEGQQANAVVLGEILEQLKLLNENMKRKPRAPKENREMPELAMLWNARANPKLARVQAMDPAGERFRSVNARWKHRPDTSYWALVIDRISASSFCLGANASGWLANFDWLIRPDTAAKVLEGKFDNRINDNNKRPEVEL